MNLVIIGGRNQKKLADIVYSTFDDMAVVCHPDVNRFMDAINIRALDIHRMLLMQDGVDSVSDDDIYNFSDLIQTSYPAMKLITLCKDMDMVKFMAELFPGGNAAHFCVTGIKAKMIADLVSKDINALNKKYDALRYKVEQNVQTEVMEEVAFEEEQEVRNEDIMGYVPPNQMVDEKRGLVSKLFGLGPKKKNNKLASDTGLQNIGQGIGVDEFTENQMPNFSQDGYGSSDDDEIDVSIFTGFGNDLDLGLGVNPEENRDNEMADEVHNIMGRYNQGDNESGFADDNELEIPKVSANLEKEDLYAPKARADLLKKDEPKVKANLKKSELDEPIFDIDINIDSPEEEQEEDIDISIPRVDLNSLKQRVQNVDLSVSDDVRRMNNTPVIPSMELDEAESETIDLFNTDMDSLMQDYENSNKQVVERVVERVVEKVVTVNGGGGPDSFRNKNGVKILIVTGDRRVGSTKLALNLANLYAKREKVLYVDMDRVRHGSIGYLDLDNILDEEEHVQNGLNHLKSLNILPNVLHLYNKGGFFTLLSMYGTEISDEQMIRAQEVLCKQREFSTVIIDCPIENIYLLRDIIYLSKILICAEDDKVGMLNLITMLGSCCGEERFLLALFDRSYFIVGRKGNIDKFRRTVAMISDMFEMELCDWNNVEILGVLKNTVALAERIGD